MPGAPSSFLLLVVRPGAPGSVLAPSSDARSPQKHNIQIAHEPTSDGLQPASDCLQPASVFVRV